MGCHGLPRDNMGYFGMYISNSLLRFRYLEETGLCVAPPSHLTKYSMKQYEAV